MAPQDKNRFYLLWTVAIFLCTAAAVFLLLRASFTDPKENDTTPPSYGQTETFDR